MEKWKRSILFGAIYLLAFFGMEYIVKLAFSDSPARGVYGSLSGIWFCLYLSSVLKLDMKSALVAYVLFVGYAFLVVYCGFPSDYHDPEVILAMIGGIFYISPIAINIGVQKIVEKFNRKKCAHE